MINFRCPVCGNTLTEEEKLFHCPKGHSFDKSKFSYVNLLMSNQSSARRHGDDRAMIKARRDFLDKGYYSFLRDKIIDICLDNIVEGGNILDCGCGECYYSQPLPDKFNPAGIDISKDALEFAHKRGIKFPLAVASAYNLPFNDNTFDGLLNIFSPFASEEFSRVIKPGGLLITVIPGEDHLFELKKAVYDKPILNDALLPSPEGFEQLKKIDTEQNIRIDSNEDIKSLFMMTPYYYKTSKADQAKLDNLTSLEVRAQFSILIFRKKELI